MNIDKYVVFDVETPNARNHRMSAIGVSVVENGRIVKECGTLVNPECHFDDFNIALTGITPEMAAKAPTFPEVWEWLRPDFEVGVLVAHNAPFDMSVLCKCLRDYRIHWKKEAVYACTCRMGRYCYPGLPNHRLNTLCSRCGIALEHHRAESDSSAAARLLLDYLEMGLDVTPFLRRYDLSVGKTFPY